MTKSVMDELKAMIGQRPRGEADQLLRHISPVIDSAMQALAAYTMETEGSVVPSKVVSFSASLSASILSTFVEEYLKFLKSTGLFTNDIPALREAMYEAILSMQKVGFDQVCEEDK